MAEAASQVKHPCGICMEPSEVHRGGTGCTHAFCLACLAGHVSAKVEAGAAAVRCPDASCAGALDPELCRAALPGDVFERWCFALCESMFLGAQRTYCPFPDCSEMMVADDDDDGDGESVECVTQSECHGCRRLFCARCGVPWHAGVSCSVGASSSSTSRPGVAAATATFVFCKICMDAVPLSEAHRVCRGCAHAFCAACLAGYIGAKIQDRIADVKCPEERCAGVLDPALCQGMLPREVFERWGAALCESMMLGVRRTYCPFKDCSAMMVVDDGYAGNVVQSECQVCRRLFCARCGVPWHAGADCAAYRKLGKGDKGREDMMLLDMAKRNKWKRCPKCEFFVQKIDGCLHITCRCGFEFCYGCGKQWGVAHASCSTA